jgi:type IV pilus assembly protein PilM
MGFFNKNIISFKPTVFGLDMSDFSIKVLQLECDEKNEEIRSFGAMDIAPGNIKDGKIINKEKISEIIKEVIKKSGPRKINTKKVICSVPESKAFMRIVNIPKLNDAEAAEAIKWEIEASIPLSIDQVYYDWQFIDFDEKGRQNILTAAVAKDTINDLIEVLEKAGLEVYGMEVESVASARSLIKKNEESVQSSLIVDLGSQKTSFIVVSKGITYFTSSIPFSSESINDAIAKRLNLNIQEAEKVKVNQGIKYSNGENPIFSAVKSLLENLTQEIEKTIDFYSELSGEASKIEKIILCGGGANLNGLISYLAEKLGKEVQLGNPLVNLKIDKKTPIINRENSVRYCTVVGLALHESIYED